MLLSFLRHWNEKSAHIYIYIYIYIFFFVTEYHYVQEGFIADNNENVVRLTKRIEVEKNAREMKRERK